MKQLKPTTIHILKGLLPYTQENVLLSFKPSSFFNELESISRKQGSHAQRIKASTYRQSYYRAIKKGLININQQGQPSITELGEAQLSIYEPKQLPGAVLLVIFDIEEREKAKRHELRLLLRMLKFRLIQRSVWSSQYDSREILAKEIQRLGLDDSVVVYEARDIRKL